MSVIVTGAISPMRRSRRHHLHRLQIWGAADKLARQPAGLFEQHVKRLAATGRVERLAVALDHILQSRQALGFFFFRDLLIQFGSRRSRTRGIFEGVRAGIFHRIDQLAAYRENPLRFRRESRQ